MASCDVCGCVVQRGDGFVLTTKEVVSSQSYWRYALSTHPHILTLPPQERQQALKGFASVLANQSEPWLICGKCVGHFDVDRPTALRRVNDFWRGIRADTFGPASFDDVRLPPLSSSVEGSLLPRPSAIYLFGNGFQPTESQLHFAMRGLLDAHSPHLTAEHLVMVPVEVTKTPNVDLEMFMKSFDIPAREHPGAHIIDMCVLDIKTQRHMALVAVWDEPDTRIARELVPDRDDYVKILKRS